MSPRHLRLLLPALLLALVLQMGPSCGVGLCSLTRSMKQTPGSPLVHAERTIMSHISPTV